MFSTTILFYIGRSRNVPTVKVHGESKVNNFFSQWLCYLCFLKWKFLDFIRLVFWRLGLAKTIIDFILKFLNKINLKTLLKVILKMC